MAKERLFDLPETKGSFQLKGKVSGTEKDNFYKQSKTSTGKDMRSINFGTEVEDGKTVYVSVQAFPRDEVVFYKSGDKAKNIKGESVKVPWANRHTFNREGFKLIGMNIGVSKTVDEKGKTVNDKKTLVEFDACNEIGTNLKDGNSVFVKGNLEYSSFTTDKNDLKRAIKFVPNQISLCADVKFDDENFEAIHDFTQNIVFVGIDKEKDIDGKETGRFVLSAKIITYTTIEDAEFIVTSAKFASVLKKNVKPYNALTVWGKIESTKQVEEVKTEDDGWGESNAMEKVTEPTKRELIITGADKDSVDTTTYSEKSIEEAMVKIINSKAAKRDYADASDNSGWGDTSKLNSTSDDDGDGWD